MFSKRTKVSIDTATTSHLNDKRNTSPDSEEQYLDTSFYQKNTGAGAGPWARPGPEASELWNNIEKYKNEYYSENKKAFFFKKSQKLDCAANISSKFDIEDLLSQTFAILPNTNRIYLDYTVFKLYANPENYTTIVEYVIKLFNICIDKYGSFECHFNLKSFTITAAERYKSVIELFCKECLKSETRYGSMMQKMYIYYSPGMIEKLTSIFSHLIDPLIRDRFVVYNKEESDDKMIENLSN